MYTIGITGGVGAGKSTVLSMIQAYCQNRTCGGKPIRAVIIQMDDVARAMQAKGEALFVQIVEAFGDGVVGQDGELNRGALAEVIFHDDAKRKLLNRIVHPAVKRAVLAKHQEACEKQCHLFVMESALLFDDGYEQLCDSVWLVASSTPARILRLRQSRGYTEEKACAMIQAQQSQEELASRCRIVIPNDGPVEETDQFVGELLDHILTIEEGIVTDEII